MAALTADSNVPAKASSHDMKNSGGVSATVNIFKGALLVYAGGFLEPGTTATGLVVAGRAETAADNTAGGDGDINVEVNSGIFRYVNSAGDAVPATQVGALCFIEDDQTVSATNGGATQSAAGTVYEVDADGVWVSMHYPLMGA